MAGFKLSGETIVTGSDLFVPKIEVGASQRIRLVADEAWKQEQTWAVAPNDSGGTRNIPVNMLPLEQAQAIVLCDGRTLAMLDAQLRYRMVVLALVDGVWDLRLLEGPKSIFGKVQDYMNDPDWGDWTGYEMEITAGKRGEYTIYDVKALPPSPATPEQQQIVQEKWADVYATAPFKEQTMEEVVEALGATVVSAGQAAGPQGFTQSTAPAVPVAAPPVPMAAPPPAVAPPAASPPPPAPPVPMGDMNDRPGAVQPPGATPPGWNSGG